MSTDGGFGAGGNSDAQQCLQSFWPRVMEEIRNLTVVKDALNNIPELLGYLIFFQVYEYLWEGKGTGALHFLSTY